MATFCLLKCRQTFDSLPFLKRLQRAATSASTFRRNWNFLRHAINLHSPAILRHAGILWRKGASRNGASLKLAALLTS
jgi:hypothetical protein